MKTVAIILGIMIVLVATKDYDINPVCFEAKRLRDNPREQERWERVKVDSPHLLEECDL